MIYYALFPHLKVSHISLGRETSLKQTTKSHEGGGAAGLIFTGMILGQKGPLIMGFPSCALSRRRVFIFGGPLPGRRRGPAGGTAPQLLTCTVQAESLFFVGK